MNTLQRKNQKAIPSDPVPSHGAPAETTGSHAEDAEIVAIRDPEVDVAEILRRIRHNMAVRQRLPPLAAALGRARMAEERHKLRKAILDVQERMEDLGKVDTHQAGWLASIDLTVKKLVRKLINRHLHQQQLVHERLVLVLDQIVGYLDDQDQCLRTCIDQAQRQTGCQTEPNRFS
jgi:hypothetical protein